MVEVFEIMSLKSIKSKSIMIQGTSSHVGKSVAVAAICRILVQDGYNVCPFKSQNMALNSYITANGGEMGRAQVVQAEACRIKPEVYMNPILIKPVADTCAQIIFMGKVVKNMSAVEYNDKKIYYLDKIRKILTDLKKRFDFIIIEGAGSPAEINLLANDIVNMKAAEVSSSPVVLVGDIDRGGVFASFYGTVKLLPRNYRKYIKGLLVNKFRGDIKLLKDGNDYIAKKLKIPVIGTIPYFRDIYIEEEDSVNLEREKAKGLILRGICKDKKDGRIIIGVIYLPHISNFTDFNAFELEKSVSLIYIKNRQELESLKPHMIIIPGSKSTINDFLYIRKSGLVEEIKKQYRKGTMVLGICGGYQMLGKKITDKFRSESDMESIEGIGLLDISTEFLQDKNTYQVDFEINVNALNCNNDFKEAYKKIVSSSVEAVRMRGYEIHMGISKKNHRKGDELIPLFKIKSRGDTAIETNDGFVAFGSRTGSIVLGTYIHGILDNFIFRKIILELLRKKNNIKDNSISSDSVSYKNFKEEQYDKLADIFRENMDMKLFYKILKHGV